MLFHLLRSIYDLAMDILRRHLLLTATLLVAISVIVNFARPAPIVLGNDGVDAAYVSEQADESAPENAGPKCPCPTEIEKVDCDGGMCSVILNAAERRIISTKPFSHEADRLEVWHSANSAPDPDPPRTNV